MSFLAQYGMFFAKLFTLIIGLLVLLLGVVAILTRNKTEAKEHLTIKKMNDRFTAMANAMKEMALTKSEFKADQKQLKKQQKQEAENKRKRLFILNFDGDMRASAVNALRNEITAVLTLATAQDEVVLLLESPGGMVNAYGLAASQLKRIRERSIPLTICIDKIAASGGYMMACVANKIIAAPFAIIGSIGVVAQIPNFHRLMKKNDVDYELLTGGEYKRTLTVFGENTEKARQKVQEDINQIHGLFKEFISLNRQQVNIDDVATGEYWMAAHAKEKALVDELATSDDYLFEAAKNADLFEVKFRSKKSLPEKVLSAMSAGFNNLITHLRYSLY